MYGIGGFADLGLRGVVELAALRQRQVVEAGARELDGEPDRVVDARAALDDLVAEEAQRRRSALPTRARTAAMTSSGRRTRASRAPP